jgi:transposase
MQRKGYPSDVSDEEWAFVVPYLSLIDPESPQREHDLREVFNALRYLVRSGAPWRYLPQDLPPWSAVYQQTQRWIKAGVFEVMVHDLREVLRIYAGRKAKPTAAILDSRTLQGTPESAGHAGYDGAKRKKGSKVHLAVDTLGHLLALNVTPANEGDRSQVAALSQAVQEATGQNVKVAWVDQGYTGQQSAEAAAEHGIELEVVKLQEAKKGFVLLPRRWVVERSFAWATRFRRLAKDYERLPETVAGLHFLAFACLMLKNVAKLF